MSDVTRTGMFKVEDITFKNARRQSEIEREIALENGEFDKPDDVKPPVSMTPEQVKNFYLQKIKKTSDSNEKRVYAQTIMWIDERLEATKENVALKLKLALYKRSESKDEDTGIDEE